MTNQRRARDKDKTVQDILSAAKSLFSDKGLNGTSIRDVENASGVSKGLILYHFASKEKLYSAVQDLLAREYIATMDKQRQKSKDFRDLVTGAVRNSLIYSKNSPEYGRIALWSYLEGHERNTELEQRFRNALVDIMRSGQRSGSVRDDIEAFLMPFIIKGSIDYWIQKEKSVQKLQGHDAVPEGNLDERLIDALVKLFLK